MAFNREHGDGHAGGFEGGYRPQIPGTRPRRPQTDYGSTMVQWMKHRRRGKTRIEQERPSPSYIIDMLPPAARLMNPADSIPAKHLHSSLNKIKHPVNVVRWTPEGRRLLTGSTSGEFTLWNGMGFNFETIMSAHESAIRDAAWSHSGDWLVSADQEGYIKYWQPNFNMVNAFSGHEAAIRGMAWSPSDSKFVTASDDTTLKVWDFSRGIAESTLKGHGWDAKAVDWHPTKGLLVSGSKDHQVKLWDPRNGRCLTTLHGHKNTLTKTLFEPNKGVLLATAARDQTARIFDLRMMRDVLLLRGHEKDIMTLTWHPVHASLLSTGGYEGALHHYLLDEPNTPTTSTTNSAQATATLSPYDTADPLNAPVQTLYPAHRIPHAHDSAIWGLSWHPLGHILASGSNDRITRFWARPRPGDFDCYKDRYHLGEAAADAGGSYNRSRRQREKEEEDMEAEDEADGLVDQKIPGVGHMGLPGLSALPGLANAISAMAGRDGSSTGGAQPQPFPNFPGMGPSGILPTPNMPGLVAPMQNGNGMLPPPPIDPKQIANMTPAQLAGLFGGKFPPLPPPPHLLQSGQLPPGFPMPLPMPPNLNGTGASGAGVQGPPGFPGMPGFPGLQQGFGQGQVVVQDGSDGIRKRGPLPSQQEQMSRDGLRGGNGR